MKRFAVMAVIPLFAGFLYAQDQTTQTTTTTTTTLNGTLVDAACRITKTEHNSSSTTTPDENTTKTETTHSTSESVDCPVTTTTTTFGLMTPEGKYVRFDEPSNTKIVEIAKNNKKWNKYIVAREALKVEVAGRPRGDVIVMESIR